VVGSVYQKNFAYTKHINMYATEERLLDVTAQYLQQIKEYCDKNDLRAIVVSGWF
jgi:ABC-type Zn uptake system ZnuABC Zn-binding protein ZnuA